MLSAPPASPPDAARRLPCPGSKTDESRHKRDRNTRPQRFIAFCPQFKAAGAMEISAKADEAFKVTAALANFKRKPMPSLDYHAFPADEGASCIALRPGFRVKSTQETRTARFGPDDNSHVRRGSCWESAASEARPSTSSHGAA